MRMTKVMMVLMMIFSTALAVTSSPAKDDSKLEYTVVLLLDGVHFGTFAEVTGLASENEVVEHRVGNSEGEEIVRKIPGRLHYSNITLRRGLILDDTDLWEWRQLVADGDMESARLSGDILVYGPSGDPVAVWHFQNGWPAKVSGPQYKSDGNEVAIEELTIAHEGLFRLR